MRLVPRSFPALALVLGAVSSPLAAQQAAPRNDNYRFWLGAQGGVTVFTTPGQTRGGIPMAGGNLMIKAKRTGLMLTFQEGIGSGEATSYIRPGSGTEQSLLFNDIRLFSAHLMAFPIRSAVQPYFGVGVGLLNVVNPVAANDAALSQTDRDTIREETDAIGSIGFLSGVGGVNFNIGPLGAFGQYMYTSSASRGKLLRGPTHTLAAGLRFNLGSSRESLNGGGY